LIDWDRLQDTGGTREIQGLILRICVRRPARPGYTQPSLSKNAVNKRRSFLHPEEAGLTHINNTPLPTNHPDHRHGRGDVGIEKFRSTGRLG